MDLHQGDQGSPFINDIGLVPPSPDLNPSSHYGSVLEFSANPASGSFHNSPYSAHSELSFVTAENDLSFELFSGDEGPSGLFGSAIPAPTDFDYDPTDYDPPNSGASLMMYPDNDYMSPPMLGSPSPDHLHRAASVPYDYSSPSSNNDDANDRHSRASSVSSAHRAQFFQSPRLDVAQSFEHMTVRSPSWATQPLPQHKAPSPPRLVMPQQDPLPTINAPDGDGLDGGPQLHIVPATPIGLGGSSITGAPFQNTLETLDQDVEPSWGPPEPTSRQSTPFRFPARGAGDNNGFPNTPPAPYLFPQQQRVRSKSDNALEPPAWDASYVQQQMQQQADHSALGLDLGASNNADETALPTGSSTTSVDGNPSGSASYQMQTFAFGGANDFLSPDSHSQQFGMRRAKSENGQGRPGHRQSRSEDIRGLQQPGLQLPQQHQQQHFMSHSSHGHSLSLSAPRGQQLFLPQNDFMSSQPQNPNLLSTNMLPPLRSVSPGPGHIRRASSGSRAGRGIGAVSWLAEYGSAASARATPYPSPSPKASPRMRYDELELDLERENGMEIPQGVSSAGFENEVALSGRMALNAVAKQQQNMLDVKDFLGNDVIVQPQVSKPNVTTVRTANASHKRRKQEASFVCPFPGCGSTFTRSFNLKGHIRSHNEEKPFVCHWPGCGKGFARQHDCKRHEQLHTNYRPFTCEGCNRQFARMDALNRHLRSEGGSECARTQSQPPSNSSTPAAQSPPPSDAQSPPTRARSRQDHFNLSDGGSPDMGGSPWVMQGAAAVGVSL